MRESNVITNIESKTQATKYLSFSSLLFLLGYLLFAYAFRVYVHPFLLIPYFLFNGIMSFILLLPSGTNKGRNNLESIYVLFMGDKKTYVPYYPEGGENCG